MSLERVQLFFAARGLGGRVRVLDDSSATVALAAAALGTEPARIAKTLAFRHGEGCLLLVAAGDAKVDNARFRMAFGEKARMLTSEETYSMTGHAVGGVCPFAIDASIPVYLDQSLSRFTTVFPACGSANSAVELSLEELFSLSGARAWVDACKGWQVGE